MSWVRLHRKLADHPMWTGERFTRGQAWVDLILQASYKDRIAVQGNTTRTVKRGQVLNSQVALAKRWGWNRETVRVFLRLLQSLNMIAIQTSKATDTGYTLITILNYELYQGGAHDPRSLRSAIGPAIGTSIQPPSEFPDSPENSAIQTAIGPALETVSDLTTYDPSREAVPPSEPASNHHPTAIGAATIKKDKNEKKDTQDTLASQEPLGPQEVLASIKHGWHPTMCFFFEKTGRQEVTAVDLEYLLLLDEKHTPARVEREIERALERFAKAVPPWPPAELTLRYLWGSLKRQRSKPESETKRTDNEGGRPVTRLEDLPEHVR